MEKQGNYNILAYQHKKLVLKELTNFTDPDFKIQLMLSFKSERFTSYDLRLFYLHIRNINMCLKKMVKNSRTSTEDSLKNSLKFLYINYLESFVDSIVAHYFHTTANDQKKQEILDSTIMSVWEEKNFNRIINNVE